MLSSYANIGGRLEYDGSWNSVNKKAVNAGIASDFSTKFKDTVMWAKSVNGRGENQQTARGFIPATLANEFSKISDTFFDKPIEPNTMIELAARNGIDVMRVSKEMIATGDYEDKNNGNPYIVATGKIEFDMAELNNSATTSGLPNNKVFKQSTPNTLTPLGTVKIDLNVLKTKFANRPTGSSARMWKKYFTQENVITEQINLNSILAKIG